MTSMQDIR